MQTPDTQPPSMIKILRKLVADPSPPPRAVGRPRLSVILGDPARVANDVERARMKSRPLDVAATAASLSPGLVRILLLCLEDMGHRLPMWSLTGVTGCDLAWCRRRSETLGRWRLVTLSYPDDKEWKIRLTRTGRAVAWHIIATGRMARHD